MKLFANSIFCAVASAAAVERRQYAGSGHIDDDWLDPYDDDYRPDIAASVLGTQAPAAAYHHIDDDWLDPYDHEYRPDVAASVLGTQAPTAAQPYIDDDWLDPYDHEYRPDIAASVLGTQAPTAAQTYIDDDWLDPYDHEYRPDVAASVLGTQAPEAAQPHADDDWLDPYDDEYRPDVAASVLGAQTPEVTAEPTPEAAAEPTPEDVAEPAPDTSIQTTEAATETTATSSPSERAAANPLYCPPQFPAPNSEERSKLSVLFKDRLDTSEYAAHVAGYASQLLSQIDMLDDAAEHSPGYEFTTAFDNVDVAGILGLASAAPMYGCFLSSAWAEALANPGQYAKRQSEDDKIKLIVLFERRENNGVSYSYADTLESEADDLVDGVQDVAARAASADPASYDVIFSTVDVPFLLSVATQAPVYTEGLSSALEKAVSSETTTQRTSETSKTSEEATKSNYAYYTQVEDGKTHIFSVEIQTKNEGARQFAAVGGAFAAIAGLLL